MRATNDNPQLSLSGRASDPTGREEWKNETREWGDRLTPSPASSTPERVPLTLRQGLIASAKRPGKARGFTNIVGDEDDGASGLGPDTFQLVMQ
jgi:hypothetical protein